MTLILKTTRSLKKSVFKASNNAIIENSSNRANKTIIKSFKSKKAQYISNIGATREQTFLILNSNGVFIYLKKTFLKTIMLQYFDLKCYIKIEPNELCYIINKILSQLNLNFNKKTLKNKFDFS